MSSDVEATKFYIRYREGQPETEMQYYAYLGFRTLGIETASFDWIDDINAMPDLGSTVGIAGYIGDVQRGLEQISKVIPPNIDYPEELQDFLGRKIWDSTLAEVRASTSPLFVKPLEHKAFTGFVWQADRASRMRIVTHSDECPVWVSEPVEFVAEYRAMSLYRQIVGCRLYKGDWSKVPDKDIVEAGQKAMGRKAPNAFCLDWGVTADGRTLLVEMNDGYSFGHYGLSPVSYARMLSARWFQMAKDR